MIIKPPFGQQIRLNRAHPLANGLFAYWSPMVSVAGNGVRDLCNQYPATLPSTFQIAPTEYGFMQNWTATGYAATPFSGKNISVDVWSLHTRAYCSSAGSNYYSHLISVVLS